MTYFWRNQPSSSWSQLLLQFLFGERTQKSLLTVNPVEKRLQEMNVWYVMLTEVRVVKRLASPMVTSEISCWRVAFLRFATIEKFQRKENGGM